MNFVTFNNFGKASQIKAFPFHLYAFDRYCSDNLGL